MVNYFMNKLISANQLIVYYLSDDNHYCALFKRADIIFFFVKFIGLVFLEILIQCATLVCGVGFKDITKEINLKIK